MNDRTGDCRSRRGEGRQHPHYAEVVHLSDETIDALARRIVELLELDAPDPPVGQLITAAEVAKRCGVDRSWVYAHAEELGAVRLGDGERPRLRFSPSEVSARIAALGIAEPPSGRRLAPIGSDARRDSLSRRRRASVVGQARAAGRRSNAPGPAPAR